MNVPQRLINGDILNLINNNVVHKDTMVKEIRGLKCPNHEFVRDNHNFTYDLPIGLNPTNGTRCCRCGYTKSLHKPQR